LNSVQVLKTNN